MSFKKGLSLLLCLIMIFSTAITPSYAAFGNKTKTPAIINVAEKITGVVINSFAKMINKTKGIDETDIPSATVNPPSWIEYNGDAIENPEQILNAETWVANEIVFESDKAYADPFNDVDAELHLFGNGRLYKIPAFWDGKNTWKIRFVCPSAGVWYFRTVCTDAENTSLGGRTGKIICSEYSGEHDIYKHGFVTTKKGEKYFTYDDGTEFFYIGDTHWSLGDETVDMVKAICEKRVSQGFTVYQSEPIGATFDFTNGITEDDMAGLAVYDEKFAIIAENGLVHANAQFFFSYYIEPLVSNHGGFIGDTLSDPAKAYLEKVCRYWVARYGAYPVIWTLGQEVDNDFYRSETNHPEWGLWNNPYKLVAEYIAKHDAYDHPLSAHQENTGATAAYGNGDGATDECKVYLKDVPSSCFRDVKAHNFYAAQWHPTKTGQIDFNIGKDYWYNSQGKPAINYEGQYCYLWTKNFGSRMQGWVAYLNGMYGYGWGGHDTWSYLNIYDEENDSSDGVDTITSEEKINATWQDALEYESSYQVGYMREFFEKTEWYNLIPRFDNKAYFVPANNVYYSYASNENNTEIVVYFYSFTDSSVAQKANTILYGGIKTGTIGSLVPKEKYTYQWFDPISGEYSEEYEFTSTAFGTYYLGDKPQATDMAVVIRSAN
ncbi:MAG: DUF4038 domain-containing protein [Clostridia bacterium]|nr:DUF4038 domain-containing protein [Clostridia bacterium]